MQYILKHKNVDVAEIYIDENEYRISNITELFSLEHLPIGTCQKNITNRKLLNSWWKSRSIPASRQGLTEVLEKLDITSQYQLISKSLGLSLSDHYWIVPKGKDIKWEDVNFFQNNFSEDVGNLLFGEKTASAKADLMSPDNTSDGWLKKKWKIINGKRCLIKGGSLPFMQEPVNEAVAYRISKQLGIPHVPYFLSWDKNIPYSVCEDLIDVNTELIPARHVALTHPKPNHVSKYNHYIYCCKKHGLKDITQAIDKMLVLDYIIGNQDRHWNNFGIIRNANTLKWISPAPIYDSGSSLGYNKATSKLLTPEDIKCKPFKEYHEEQIKLVKSFDWLNLKPAYDVIDEYSDLLKQSEDIDEPRRSALCSFLEKRLNMLQNIIEKQHKKQFSINYIPEKEKYNDYEL